VSVWLLPGVEGLEAGCGLAAPVGCGWGASGRDRRLLREAVLDIPFMACSLMKTLTFGQAEGYT
jgi:hypothetical protein